MATILNPYLTFRDSTREAIEFYHSVFGGVMTLITFKDLHAAEHPSEDNLIMHGQLDTPGGMTLMGQDSPSQMDWYPRDSMRISLSGDDEAELRCYWDRLSRGAEIVMPLDEVPWSKAFGMLVDRFGISWMVNADLPVES